MSDIEHVTKRNALSNWQIIIFALILRVTRAKGPRFYRTELLSTTNVDLAVNWSRKLGHKKDPQHPEETMQRTLQTMRDLKYLRFLDRGIYELTDIGILFVDKFREPLTALADGKLDTPSLITKFRDLLSD
jgi:hypothetical protein